jgi:hypothetical protein
MRRVLRRSLVAYSRALQGRDTQARPMIVRGRMAALEALGALESHQGIPASVSRLQQAVALHQKVKPGASDLDVGLRCWHGDGFL